MPRAPKTTPQEPVDVDALLATYREWLAHQGVCLATEQNCGSSVSRSCRWPS